MITVFDLDYTLLDTARLKDDMNRCFRLAAAGADFSADYKSYFKIPGAPVNFSMDLYVDRLKQDGRIDPRQGESLRAEFGRIMAGLKDYLFPGWAEIIGHYRDRGDETILATFGDKAYQQVKISSLAIGDYFDEIIYEDRDKRENGFLEKLKKSGQKIRFINDNAWESLKMMRAIGEDCELYLIKGPYFHNTKEEREEFVGRKVEFFDSLKILSNLKL